jgi:hypothetical protein
VARIGLEERHVVDRAQTPSEIDEIDSALKVEYSGVKKTLTRERVEA